MRYLLGLMAACLFSPAHAAEKITVTGEAIDTWCYFSGVMGGEDAVRGSAHHTCALWCAAGGIPVGLLAEDGTVYMVLKIEDDDNTNSGNGLLTIASHEITAEGTHYVRDGVNIWLCRMSWRMPVSPTSTMRITTSSRPSQFQRNG